MLQLQQLGLPLGYRSKVEWWLNSKINFYHHATNFNQKKEHSRRTNCREKADY